MRLHPARLSVALAALLVAAPLAAQQAPAAIYTDPPHDAKHPARMEVLHIPSGGVKINGVAYLASGAGVHPTFVLLHGLPGNEKNLDLAQAVRRAGWNAITFNYRGSWGSPGVFRFGQNLEDADAVLAYLRAPANVKALGIDTTRMVIAGHSMGGWVTVRTAAHDHRLRGAVLISAADMAADGGRPRDSVVALMADNMESLAGTSAAQMADELIAHKDDWNFATAYDGLARIPLLVLTSNDGLAPMNNALVAAVRARGNTRVTAVHLPTDHSYSDQRIALESDVLRWLQGIAK
ncbi:MAG TPA: alpha/beta fold hydrolase [Gemmatimonadaceae bacterium]|nr:alpha/beta fold hydrolase [Gemmatimonadaceae bacterium]